jgi:hypothetical protein
VATNGTASIASRSASQESSVATNGTASGESQASAEPSPMNNEKTETKDDAWNFDDFDDDF